MSFQNNKKALIKKIEAIGDLKIKQGIEYKTLSLSLQQHYKDKPLKEWKELVKDFITEVK